MLKVSINGNEVDVEENSSIQELLDSRKVTGKMFVVERNLEVVPKDQYEKIKVQSNDSYEIVGFFGGG